MILKDQEPKLHKLKSHRIDKEVKKTKKKPDKHYYELLEIMHEQGAKMTPKELRSLHKEMVQYGWFMGVPFMNRYPEFPLYVQTVTLLILIVPLILDWCIRHIL